ncbi:MAG: rod shape-determining protein MreD [Rhodobacteraceae bacterium HLUCCA24]|nr:MAG: rod shape-determining protein MreD [Rhodobacteraceae bacterium HLUCCA24]
MAKVQGNGLWLKRTVFLVLCIAVIFFSLLPLDTGTPRWAPPDLLLALCLVWAARRPDYVPVLSIAFVALLADLLYQRPPGLYAALTVLGSEYLKARARMLRDSGFWVEWATAAAVLTVIALAYRLALGLLAVPQPPLALSLVQVLATVAIYPPVVAVSHLFLGLRRPAASDPGGTRLGT